VTTSEPSSDAPVVAVYRQELFKVTEPFVVDQALSLAHHRPLFVGERVFSSAAPTDAQVVVPRPMRLFERLRYNWLRNPSRFLELLLPHRPALVHAHFGIDAAYALPLAKNLGRPLVTTFHGYDATRSNRAFLRSANPKWITYLRCRAQLAREGDLFIAVSDFIRERLLQRGFPEERTKTLYTGVDLQRFSPSPPPESPIVLHVARLTPKKGTSDLISAMRLLRRRVPEARLMIIGDGPLRKRLEDQAAHEGVSDVVRFLGGLADRADVVEWTRRSAVACLPSVTAPDGDAEGFGMTLLEAAAMERPVVATRHGAFAEVVENGVTGLLVQERNPRELADALEAILGDPQRSRAMGVAGRRRAEAMFDLRAQTARLEREYARLIGAT